MKHINLFEQHINENNDEMLNAYLDTALWTEELDGDFDRDDIDPKSKEDAKKDCDLFKSMIKDIINELDLSQIGHDFWLTRNGHGAGFWDGDYENSIETELMKATKNFKTKDIYKGDDGKIYIY